MAKVNSSAGLLKAVQWMGSQAMTLDVVRRAMNQSTNPIFKNLIPELPDAFRAAMQGHVPGRWLANLMSLWGASSNNLVGFEPLYTYHHDQCDFPGEDKIDRGNFWARVFRTGITIPSPGQILELLNRGAVTNRAAEEMIRHHGFYEPAIIAAFSQLRYYIPSPQDIIHMAVKEAFKDQTTIDRLGLDDEYPPDYAFWAARQGLGKVKAIDNATGTEREYDFARGYWRAHWRLPSAEEAFHFYQRLRPNRIKNWGNSVPGLQAFRFPDLELLLKALDYSRPYRPQLAAIAYRVPTRVDIRRMYAIGIFGKGEAGFKELVERHKDIGYNDADAVALSRFTVKQAAASRALTLQTLTRKEIEKGVHLGIINDQDAIGLLEKLGLETEDAIAAFDAIKLNIRIKFVADTVAGIKSRWMQGEVSENETRGLLRQTGMEHSRVEDFILTWKLQRNRRRVEFTASKIRQLAKEGIITLAQAQQRLNNLGYPDDQVNLLLAEIIYDYVVAIAKAAAANAKSKKAAIQAQQKVIRAQQADLKRSQRLLAQHGSPERVKRWEKKGLITHDAAMERLQKMGWPAEDAAKLLEE